LSEYRCRFCGHFHANFVEHRFNIKHLPKRCQRCRKPYPLGTPEEWLKKHSDKEGSSS
jgi:hypothetical protein